MISAVVLGNQSLNSATAAFAAGTGSVTSQCNGLRVFHTFSNSSKPGIDFAAIVLMGPAATKLIRIFSFPKSRAKYREVDSSAALATPIQSYLGQAT